MAHVEKRGSGRWRARYRVSDGTERSQTFATRGAAERFLTEIEHSKNVGAYIDPAAGRELFRDFAERWFAGQVYRPTTEERVRMNLDSHILPAFGDRRLEWIKPSEVQAWVRKMSGTHAPATVEVIYRHLTSVLRSAVDDGLLGSTPCRNIKLPKKARPRIQPLTIEQVRALVDHAPARLKAPIFIAATSGLRQGEVLGLQVDDIDFLRRTIRVEHQLVTVNKRPPSLEPPKTESSRRTIPVPQSVIDAVAEHLTRFPTDGFIFTNTAGAPWRRTRIGEAWRPTVARAGLPHGTRFHELRHFYASLLIRHGESVKTVQVRLGHASASETLNTYAHLWPDSDDRTREAVEEAFRDLTVPGRDHGMA
jgi:integrase